jgi:hypothetical protein
MVGRSIAPVVFTAGGGATNINSTVLPPGITAIFSGAGNLTLTISGTPSEPNLFDFEVSASNPLERVSLDVSISVVADSVASSSTMAARIAGITVGLSVATLCAALAVVCIIWRVRKRRRLRRLSEDADMLHERLISMKKLSDAEYPDDFFNLSISKGSSEGSDSPLTIRDYVTNKRLGRGTFGDALLCTHASLPGWFVVKRIAKPTQTEAAAGGAVDWRREADAMAAVESPHVVQLIESFEDELFGYIVMEYCAEGSLRQLMNQRRTANEPFAASVCPNHLVSQICTFRGLTFLPLLRKCGYWWVKLQRGCEICTG